MTAMAMTACTGQKAEKAEATQDNFNYVVDQFADLQILRYQVPGFESLSLKQKQLLYHLSEAALMGRDILFDQNCRYNLPIRRALEAVYTGYKGDRTDPQFVALETYLKRVWFANAFIIIMRKTNLFPVLRPNSSRLASLRSVLPHFRYVKGRRWNSLLPRSVP